MYHMLRISSRALLRTFLSTPARISRRAKGALHDICQDARKVVFFSQGVRKGLRNNLRTAARNGVRNIVQIWVPINICIYIYIYIYIMFNLCLIYNLN